MLRTFDADTQRALHDLEGHIDVDRARRVWADALSAPWDGVDRWFHGDMADGNLLLDDAGQQAFRERLEVDDATWARGRGWRSGWR